VALAGTLLGAAIHVLSRAEPPSAEAIGSIGLLWFAGAFYGAATLLAGLQHLLQPTRGAVNAVPNRPFERPRGSVDRGTAIPSVQTVRLQKGSAMTTVASLAVALVALLHLYFLILEMFLWEKPLGLRTFALTPEFAKASKALAANQGLYNGFLVAGLVWGLSPGTTGNPIKIFFLSCVVVAGVFGGLTANRKILWVQALPGAIALALVFAS